MPDLGFAQGLEGAGRESGLAAAARTGDGDLGSGRRLTVPTGPEPQFCKIRMPIGSAVRYPTAAPKRSR
jgi:hypothetical protein